uniref:FAD-binding PCMH-type domain-containing protein n=1 Tax=Caenorhabditis tropicalis TaxID=1561998 RepID=A0A1I7T8K8_9PELO
MSKTGKVAKFPLPHDNNMPTYTNEETVDSQEGEIDVVNGQTTDIEVDVYGGANINEYFYAIEDRGPAIKRVKRDNNVGRKLDKMEKIANSMAGERIDLVELGTNVMVGTSDRTLNHVAVEKAIKSGVSEAPFLGEISMETLVEGMLRPQAADGRFAMLGTSVMWNALKSNMRELKVNILEQTAQTYAEPRFDAIDISIDNISSFQYDYLIESAKVFAEADLYYIFSLLTFRKAAKLLNKTKQFLKAYFVISCRPRCMIWRYTLRRAGNSNRKAILNLPENIVQSLLKFLIDLTGIGSGEKSFHELEHSTPFYHSLGEDEVLKEQRYYETCKLKDPLLRFFRDAITDVLNEVREMPFSLATGTLVSPLRGRKQTCSYVMWRDYETFLKNENELPSEMNIKKRMMFEQTLCRIPSIERPPHY